MPQATAIRRAGRIAEDLTNRSRGESRPPVVGPVRHVMVGSDAVEIEIDRQRPASVLQADSREPPDADATDNDHSEDIVTLTIPASLCRPGAKCA